MAIKQTPSHDNANSELLAMVPLGARRIVEVGCSSGAMARDYRSRNPACEYVGIEIEPSYAELARRYCSRVVIANIEAIDDQAFGSLFPSDCWIFADVLEHLYDPWSVLSRIRASIDPDGSVLACIPNAQHWMVQSRLNSGAFRYEDAGLLDRTHIRWFTRLTVGELFESCGFHIVEGGGRVFDEPMREMALLGVQAFAEAIGTDANQAVQDAIPLQWLVRAMPK